MLINSIQFLLFFLVVYMVYWLLRNNYKVQNWLLLGASYYFYGVASLEMCILLLLITCTLYGIGLMIEKYNEQDSCKAKLWTVFGATIGVGLLLYFKYMNFFIENFTALISVVGFRCDSHTINIIMPIGVSFFTFKLISYVIEVYRKSMPATKDFVAFATYVAFFPTIMSGPIDRPNKFVPQLLLNRNLQWDLQLRGLQQILWGMFKKMVIADNLASVVNVAWDNTSLVGSSYVVAMFFYSVQIYADFSGYSDMAIGVGKLLGFDIMRNFNYPYFSRNISEFWRRWHISLTSWFTDYIYIPLGGNRLGKIRTILNSLVVFTICGFWHGADWSFVLWGFLNGALFIPYLLQNKPKKYKNVPLTISVDTIMRMVLMFFLSSICWVFFRAEDVNSAFSFLGRMFDISLLSIPRFTGMTNITFLIMIPYLILFTIFEWRGRDKECPIFMKSPYGWLQFVNYAFLVVSIYFLGTDSSSFIYFNF